MPEALTMADHVQQQIIEAFAAALGASASPAAGSVHVEPADPLPQSRLPAWVVQEDDGGETIEPFTIKDVEQRVLAVQVISVAAAVSATDGVAAKAVRNLGRDAEVAIKSSAALKAVGRAELVISAPQFGGEGDRQRAARVQTWRFTYRAQRLTPDVPL
jgi:hypothetical protein